MGIASVFTSGMVLQQGVAVPVWGTAIPGRKVTVRFAEQEKASITDTEGRWKVMLDSLTACADPRTLQISSTHNQQPITLHDVLVGEVWVCSGQSNMQWPVAGSNRGAEEVRAANFPEIRLFTVPNVPSGEPESNIAGAAWSVCSPDTISPFSAVAYFFGRELHRRLKVPIGLINTSWGGTVAEAWTSWGTLSGDPSLRGIVENFERDLPRLAQRREAWSRDFKALEEQISDKGNTKYSEGWAGPAEPDGNWADMELPGIWQGKGLNFSGILWFRKTIEIPAGWAGKDLNLAIGATDKSDTTYFNNEQVGSVTMADRLDSWSLLRTYTVPGKLVRAGRNVIAVRVHSDKYAGGMTGPEDVMKVFCPACGGDPVISLAGTWRYAVEENYGLVQIPVEPVGPGHQNAPSALFNGMIAPLLPYAIRGAIWYQGESNADRARQYQTLFPLMIRDWRRAWGQGDFSFYFVQLANYMAQQAQPSESQWAELREAQTMALALPNTGMAVAIDIGDAGDIHPGNKQDVGLRLAFNALNQTYGLREVMPCGPLFRLVSRDGASLRLSFDFVGRGLVCRGEALQGFAIAGEDGRFVWATATIENEQVVVSSPGVSHPKVVRYAWADNPVASLYNRDGLPASPFRTDVM